MELRGKIADVIVDLCEGPCAALDAADRILNLPEIAAALKLTAVVAEDRVVCSHVWTLGDQSKECSRCGMLIMWGSEVVNPR